MSYTLQHEAVLTARDLEVRIDVNDVPIWTHATKGAVFTRVPLNPWIVGTQNRLRVNLAWPESTEPGSGKFELHVVTVGPDRSQQPPVILSYSWPPSGAQLDEERRRAIEAQRRFRSDLALAVDDVPPTRLWSIAEPIALTDADRVAVLERIKRVQLAIDRMDVELIKAALAFRTLELAAANEVSEDDVIAQLLMFFTAVVGDEEVDPDSEAGLADLEENLELHSVASGRLLWVTRANGRAALRCPAVSPRVELPIYFAKLGGRWVIAR